MLFDLRSRGRRRTVQAVYLGLAILMGGGLILFGVGTGSGIGGLLNAFTGQGSGNQQSSVFSQQVKTAERQVKANPNSAAAWGALLTARYSDAASGTSSSTTSLTSAQKTKFAAVGDAWQHYTALSSSPTENNALYAATAYGLLAQYANAAGAWEAVTQADPSSAKGYVCLAMNAYAASQTRKGDLAAAKAASMVPKANRKTLTSEINAAKTQPSLAQSC